MTVKSSYLSCVFDERYPNFVHRMCVLVQAVKARNPFDSLVFTGQSGAAIAYPVSCITGIKLTLIRRDEEKSHFVGSYKSHVEGHIEPNLRYLILDDTVSTGATCNRVYRLMSEAMPQSKLVGIALYYGGSGYVTQTIRLGDGKVMLVHRYHIDDKDWTRQPIPQQP